MEKLKIAARIAFCIGVAGMVFPEFIYKQFGNNFFPAWPNVPLLVVWVYLFTIIVLAACAVIAFDKMGRTAALILGALLLAVYLFGYFTYDLFLAPYNNHLGTWADGLKESALAGGAFVLAGSFPDNVNAYKSPLIKLLEKLIPLGPLFFCITMIAYGYAHFLYTAPISTLVPNWIPAHMFWTYFAGAALIASGLAIVFRFKVKIVGLLMGIMIFLWLIMLHIPMAFADPYGQNANSIVSSFSALAFSAIAFAIACNAALKKGVN